MEKTFPSGMKEIIFPDGAIKYLHPDGKEETTFPDGTVVRVVNGVKILEMPNGQKEIHTNNYKVRFYNASTNICLSQVWVFAVKVVSLMLMGAQFPIEFQAWHKLCHVTNSLWCFHRNIILYRIICLWVFFNYENSFFDQIWQCMQWYAVIIRECIAFEIIYRYIGGTIPYSALISQVF